ncbi:MAG: asparaginase [Candidatus Dadabacteria bacterium]|nr:MAG: asparaginase [Candidatus Dadabacteria bacterium]
MMILCNDLGESGIAAAANILSSGGAALDAIEAGIRVTEKDPSVRYVGLGGDPNILGEMELDAAIMDGSTGQAAGVGALKGFLHPISVARKIMTELPHVMLVGEGAARFAGEIGAERADLLTAEAKKRYNQWINSRLPDQYHHSVDTVELKSYVWPEKESRARRDTVVYIAIDNSGSIAAGTSSSGWGYKYPGRLGDSPIIGAGLYAQNGAGACVCTHTGEMSIRTAAAATTVRFMQQGLSVKEALHRTMLEVAKLSGGYRGSLAIYAVNCKHETHALFYGNRAAIPKYCLWQNNTQEFNLAPDYYCH